jgi:hypothetical protein
VTGGTKRVWALNAAKPRTSLHHSRTTGPKSNCGSNHAICRPPKPKTAKAYEASSSQRLILNWISYPAHDALQVHEVDRHQLAATSQRKRANQRARHSSKTINQRATTLWPGLKGKNRHT